MWNLADGLNVGLAAVYELGMDGTFTLGRVIAASDGEESDWLCLVGCNLRRASPYRLN